MFYMSPGTYIKSLVKIESVTAEIFLIWTDVARTNVAWTNVNLIVGSILDVPRNLPLKFHPNRVSNSCTSCFLLLASCILHLAYCFQLLATCHLLLDSCFLYLLIFSCYLLLASFYLLHFVSCYRLLASCLLLLVDFYLLLATFNLVILFSACWLLLLLDTVYYLLAK